MTSISDYQSLTLIEFRVKKNGVLLQYATTTGETQFQFIKVSTIVDPIIPKLYTMTNKLRNKAEHELAKLQDTLDAGKISRAKYLSMVKQVRDRIIVRPQVYRRLGKKAVISNWMTVRRNGQIEENLKQLLKVGIQIYPIPFSGGKHLILLVEQGPLFRSEFQRKHVLERASPLDLYPQVSGLKSVITWVPNHGIIPLPVLPAKHKQSIIVSDEVFESILGEFVNDQLKIDYKSLQKYFKLSYNWSSNYLLSLPYFVDEKLTLKIHDYSRFLHCMMKPNTLLLTISLDKDFNQFLQSYVTSISSHKSLNSEINSNTPNQRIYHFGNNIPSDFESRNLSELRLNLIDFQTKNGIVDFGFIFLTIDTLFGEKHFSSQSALNEAMNEFLEYDEAILEDIRTYNEFQNLIAKQLTLSSVIGNFDNISLVYQLLRQFSMKQILDPDIVKYSNRTNILDYPPLTHFDISKLQTHDVALTVIFSIFKIIQMKATTDTTFVISNHDVVLQLLQKDIISIINKLLSRYPNVRIRVIFHSTDARMEFNSIDFPIFKIRSFDQEKKQYFDKLLIGSEIDIIAKYIKIDSD